MKTVSPKSKKCVRCGRVLSLEEFYPNKSWKAQKFRDAWCKDCALQFCKDKETAKQYCYENNRTWRDGVWDSALKKAQYALSTDAEYNDSKTPSKKK